jgi:hypothetical protein
MHRHVWVYLLHFNTRSRVEISKRLLIVLLLQSQTSVVVPSFNTKEISPFTFFYNSYANCKRPGFTFVGSNPHDQYGDDELCTFTANFPLWQVARATSAAPTFFPGWFSKVPANYDTTSTEARCRGLSGSKEAFKEALRSKAFQSKCLFECHGKNPPCNWLPVLSVPR